MAVVSNAFLPGAVGSSALKPEGAFCRDAKFMMGAVSVGIKLPRVQQWLDDDTSRDLPTSSFIPWEERASPSVSPSTCV